MQRSVIYKPAKFNLLVMLICLLHCSFNVDKTDWLSWANNCLLQSYDSIDDIKLKKRELMITSDSFIRLRKTYQNGKQEYYSFNLQRYNSINYLGTNIAGKLLIKTTKDDIIVQTYNDRAGDVDSMATMLSIPVKNMEPERLDSLQAAFNYLKQKSL
jgi:hypothetical protein